VLITISMAVLLSFYPVLGYIWLFISCTLVSLTMANYIGVFNYLLDIAPEGKTSVFLVVDACIGIPFSFAGYALGALIDFRGYIVTFCIGGFFAVAAILMSLRLISKKQMLALNKTKMIIHDEEIAT